MSGVPPRIGYSRPPVGPPPAGRATWTPLYVVFFCLLTFTIIAISVMGYFQRVGRSRTGNLLPHGPHHPQLAANLDNGWKRYRLREMGVTVEFPAALTELDERASATYSDLSYYRARGHKATLYVIGYVFAHRAPSLEGLADRRKAGIEVDDHLEDPKVEVTDVKVDGHPAKHLMAHYTIDGKTIVFESYLVRVGEHQAALFDMTARAENEASGRQDSERMIKSVRFDAR